MLRLKIQTQIVNYVNPRFVNFNEPLLLAIAVGLCTALCSFPVLMWNIMEEMQVESDNNAYEVPVIKGSLSDVVHARQEAGVGSWVHGEAAKEESQHFVR